MDTTEYLRRNAQIAVDQLASVLESYAEFEARFRELLEQPQERNPRVLGHFVGYLRERMADEAGHADGDAVAVAYYDALAPYLLLPFSRIQSVPQPERGRLWQEARAIVMSAARIQATIEVRGTLDLEFGAAAVDLLDEARLSQTQRREVAKDSGKRRAVRDFLRARKAAAREDASEDGGDGAAS